MEKIALVDDDPDILEIFTQFVALFGYHPLPFLNPLDALEQLPEEKPAPALILLDLMMTPITGLQFLEERRKNTRLTSIPVMIVSGWGLSREDLEKYGSDIVGTVQKPIEPDRLQEIILEHISQNRVVT